MYCVRKQLLCSLHLSYRWNSDPRYFVSRKWKHIRKLGTKQYLTAYIMHKSSPVFVQNVCALAEFSHSQWGRCLFTSVTGTATLSMFHLFAVAGISNKWMLAQHAHPCAATDRRIKLCLCTAQLCFSQNQSKVSLFWGWANTWAKLHHLLF